MRERMRGVAIEQRLREWITMRRGRGPRGARKYAVCEEDAIKRMKNGHLNDAQARHLTIHGAVQNEDDTYSWKFVQEHHAPQGARR